MTENKRFALRGSSIWFDNGEEITSYDVLDLLNEQHEQIEKMKSKGLKVLDFYLEKLKTTNDFQGVRDEIWIVKQVLLEMGVIE